MKKKRMLDVSEENEGKIAIFLIHIYTAMPMSRTVPQIS